MEFADVVRRRHMVRAFDDRPVDPEVLERLLDVARRGPSAGYSQGVDLLVLEGRDQTDRYWSLSFADGQARAAFRWQGLFAAPVLILPLVSPAAYYARYAEADKAGAGATPPADWNVPYWWVDGGMATMLLLLAAVDAGLGALYFTLERPADLLAAFAVPDDHRALGTVAVGHPASDSRGRSSLRPRRALGEVVHRGHW